MPESDTKHLDVRDLLNEVALATAQSTVAAVEHEELKKEDHEYILNEAVLLGEGGLTASRRKVVRQTWDAYAANRIVGEIQERLAVAVEDCAQQLTSSRKDTPTARGDLGYFLLAVVKRAADDSATAFVPQMVDRFLFEYGGGELEWIGEIWLKGIRVKEAVQVQSGFVLRPPEAKDFTNEWPTELGWLGAASTALTSFPDAVLELSTRACNRPDYRREITALSLFRLGAVEVLQEDWRSDSLLPYMGGHQTPLRTNPHTPFPAYEVSQAEVASLAAFLKAVAADLPPKPLGHHANPRWLGLKNYFRALQTATDTEERLGQAVASLEASLLSDKKGPELGYRLSLRTASLLRCAGFKATEVFRNTRAAYDFRSTYAHGGEISKKNLEGARELCPRIMEYARLAIVKLIEFPEKTQRNSILSRLDLGLIDDDERRQMESTLRSGLWNYTVE